MKTIKINTNYLANDFRSVMCFIMMILLMFSVPGLMAQDLIVMKNGVEVKGKVLEISDQNVKYQKSEGPGELILNVKTSDIFMIRYENGSKEVFDAKSDVVSQPAHDDLKIQKFEPDSSDFARIRRKKFNGPRVGITAISPGTNADYLRSIGKRPLLTQFGWQFEGRLFTVEETSGIVEFVPMVAGLEQGLFIPSLSFLIGIRTGVHHIIEFGLGPNFTVVPDHNGNKKGFAGLVIAAGTSFKKGNVYFPITFAVVPTVGNVSEVHDPTTDKITKETYYTGWRFSLIMGFNSRKR